MNCHRLALLALPLCALMSLGQTPPQGEKKLLSPLEPQDALKTFQTRPGFRVELVAAEPDVVDPVAMTFDEDGRLYVAEMRGYPNGGVGDGKPVLPGRIKRLEDRDGDGRYETSTVFVDNLRFPTGLAVWKGGVLVGDAPDLLYFEDADADGKAEKRTVLFTGFGTKNIQQMLNSFQFHHDNWFYACNGNNESKVMAVQPDWKALPRRSLDPLMLPPPHLPADPTPLRGRHFRFTVGSPPRGGMELEPTSGGGQYGLTVDDAGNWFTSTNSQHLRHIVLPDHYLARNPHLAVPTVTVDIPDGVDDHGPAAKVFRISPLEPWRVERTTRRAGSDDRNRFPNTELFPGGYMTSACSPLVYRGGAFPAEYHGNVFVCDPANNLIHRDILEPDGPTFRARRGDKDCEFLASTDIWFRPVFLCLGPDGAMYVADFHREIIETPLSLPEDIQKRYNLQSRGRGRIWRIVHETSRKASPLRLSKVSDLELVEVLKSPNAWQRLTAQRLLNERLRFLEGYQQKEVLQRLEALVVSSPREVSAVTRLHALCLLDILLDLYGPYAVKLKALEDSSPLVRKEAVRLLEDYLGTLGRMLRSPNNDLPATRAKYETILRQVLALTNDPSPLVRYQLAFTLGEMKTGHDVAKALIALARKDGANPWHQTAILSSSLPHASAMLEELRTAHDIPLSFLARLAEMAAASSEDFTPLLLKLVSERPGVKLWTMLDGAAKGLERRGRPLRSLAEKQPSLGQELERAFRQARQTAVDPRSKVEERQAALRFLRHGPWRDLAALLTDLLTPQTPQEVQLAAVQALAHRKEPEAANILLARWSAFSPAVRREAQEVLFARTDRLTALLTALERQEIPLAQIDLARRDFLRRHPRKEIRDRAAKLLATATNTNRQQVVNDHRRVLSLSAEVSRGQAVFRKHCTTCHRLEDVGYTVGPELRATLKTKTAETLLIDILDPNREVDARFVNYALETKNGRLLTGILAAETAASVTLRRADGAEDTILRNEIENLQASGKSLMPEEFEKHIAEQELADLLAYLLDVGRRK